VHQLFISDESLTNFQVNVSKKLTAKSAISDAFVSQWLQSVRSYII